VDDVLTRFPLRVRLAADGTYVQGWTRRPPAVALEAVAPEGQELLALERFFSPESLEARTRDEWRWLRQPLRQGLTPERSTYVVGSVPLADRRCRSCWSAPSPTLLTEFGEAVCSPCAAWTRPWRR
jgi:hypothetical protein